jgi:sugar phosphate isomerase/epimerase
MILGAQTYTVRTYMQNERDIRFSLQKIAEIGYKTVQISAIGKIEPERLRAICDELGLKIVLTHSSEDRILNDTDALIREHDVLGCDYIGIGGMPERYRSSAPEWAEHFAKDFTEPAKKIAAAGKLFCYHQHNFEFEKLPDGRRIMEMLLEEMPPELMGVTLDTYWIQAAGGDVCRWIERMGDRIPCVHLKDMTVHGFEPQMAPVMEGNMNFEAILKTLERIGTTKYLLVEQDTCRESPFVCLKKSYDNLARLGYR